MTVTFVSGQNRSAIVPLWTSSAVLAISVNFCPIEVNEGPLELL